MLRLRDDKRFAIVIATLSMTAGHSANFISLRDSIGGQEIKIPTLSQKTRPGWGTRSY
jgi:hypothetical protein